eukprot:6836980-Prymnesium_polylepis.1
MAAPAQFSARARAAPAQCGAPLLGASVRSPRRSPARSGRSPWRPGASPSRQTCCRCAGSGQCSRRRE